MRTASRLNINLNYLKSNWEEVLKLSNHKKIIFMVKANAYGHGIAEISQFAYEELKANELGVASLGEALYLRKNFPHIKSEIYVFSDTNLNVEKNIDEYIENRIIPVLHNLDSLNLFLKNNKTKKIPLVLKFNTGMNRLGFDESLLAHIVETLKFHQRVEIDHVMTHFAQSYFVINGKDETTKQYEIFKKIKKSLIASGIKIHHSSCANSGAIEQNFLFEDETHVRPGLMLYGPSSLMEGKSYFQGKNVSEFETEIIDIRKVEPGTKIGYGGTKISEKGVLAILPIGYGDGFHTHYTGSEFHHLNFPNKIVGRINMDMSFLFIPESHTNFVKIGQRITIWDHQSQTVNDLANQNKTHAYQMFCGISSRIPRVYLT